MRSRCSTTCASVCPIIRRSTATSTTWRLLRPSPRPTASQSTIRRSSRISSQPTRTAHRITRTPLTCRSVIQRMFSQRLISRMICRPSTHPVQSSTPSWARNFRTGEQLPRWCARSRRTTSSHITRCRRLIRSARTTAIFTAKCTHAPSAERRPRSTAALPDTIVRSRTGTTARHRNSKTALSMISRTAS